VWGGGILKYHTNFISIRCKFTLVYLKNISFGLGVYLYKTYIRDNLEYLYKTYIRDNLEYLYKRYIRDNLEYLYRTYIRDTSVNLQFRPHFSPLKWLRRNFVIKE